MLVKFLFHVCIMLIMFLGQKSHINSPAVGLHVTIYIHRQRVADRITHLLMLV